MGKQIDKIKRQQQMSIPEILAEYIWKGAINSRDRVFRVPYCELPCYIEYCHENEDDGFRLDCLYLGQEHSFMLIRPDYKSTLAVAPSILEWLSATYAMCCPPEPPRPRRSRQNRVAQQPSRGQNGAGNGVQKRPQKTLQNGLKNAL